MSSFSKSNLINGVPNIEYGVVNTDGPTSENALFVFAVYLT